MLGKVLAVAGAIITQEDVLAQVPIDGAFTRWDLTASLREARRRFERDYIAAVLDHHQWRMSDAARALGLERANLYRKTRQLGIARIPVQKCHEVASHERATLVHAAPVQHRHPAGMASRWPGRRRPIPSVPRSVSGRLSSGRASR